MQINKTNNIYTGFRGNAVRPERIQISRQLNNGNKKLALALTGIAAASATTFVLYKSGKLNKLIDNFKQFKDKNKFNIFKKENSSTKSNDLNKPDMQKTKELVSEDERRTTTKTNYTTTQHLSGEAILNIFETFFPKQK